MIGNLLKKYKDAAFYIIFGVLTTVVNIVTYFFCSHVCRLDVKSGNVVAWFLAVSFAYLTNRKWVFRSKAVMFKDKSREAVNFYLSRLLTGIIDFVIMYVFVLSQHGAADAVVVSSMVDANATHIIFFFIVSSFPFGHKNTDILEFHSSNMSVSFSKHSIKNLAPNLNPFINVWHSVICIISS